MKLSKVNFLKGKNTNYPPTNYRGRPNYSPEPQNRTFFTSNYVNRTNYPPSTQSAMVLVYVTYTWQSSQHSIL